MAPQLLLPLIRNADEDTGDADLIVPFAGIVAVGVFIFFVFLFWRIYVRVRKPRTSLHPRSSRHPIDATHDARILPPPRAASGDHDVHILPPPRSASGAHAPPHLRFHLHPRHGMPLWAYEQPFVQHLAGGPAERQARRVPTFDVEGLNSFDVSGEDGENPCPICLGLLKEEPVSTGQCLHMMHTSCLKSWLVKDIHSACPVCRVQYQDPAASMDGVELEHVHSPWARGQGAFVPPPPLAAPQEAVGR